MLWVKSNPLARQAARHGKRWCHMWADSADDLPQLHVIARRIGLKFEWFQDKPGFPHYDLVPSKRRLAVAAGAIETELEDWLRKRRNGRGA